MKKLTGIFVMLIATAATAHEGAGAPGRGGHGGGAGGGVQREIQQLQNVNYELRDVIQGLESKFGNRPVVRDVIYQLRDANTQVRRARVDLENSRLGQRIQWVSAVGSGGTTHKDRAAACGRAEQRALAAAQQLCRNSAGFPGAFNYSGYQYVRKDSSEMICRVTANVQCQIR